MKRRIFTLILLALVGVGVWASRSECIIAQETTQLTVKIKAVAEWLISYYNASVADIFNPYNALILDKL